MSRIQKSVLLGGFLCAILCPPALWAYHLCKDDSVAVGLIGAKYQELKRRNPPAPLGCVLSEERDIPGGNGRYTDFENGQIIWSPDQNMIVAAYLLNGQIEAEWWITGQYHYDHFNVRWYIDPHTPDSATQTQADNAVKKPTEGFSTVTGGVGRYAIMVEGCDNGGSGFLGVKDTCRQGWSNPVFVDKGAIDVAHKAVDPLGTVALPTAVNPADTRALVDEHVKAALLPTCFGTLGGPLGEGFVGTAFGKLYMSDVPNLHDCPGPQLIADTNAALRIAKKEAEVGTDFDLGSPVTDGIVGAVAGAILGGLTGGIGNVVIGGILGLIGAETAVAACKHPGDYDFVLSGMMPIVYRYHNKLQTDVYQHILHDLLSESGGADKVKTSWSACDIANVPETENHIMMTESARYLTNQLLLQEVEDKHTGDPQSPELALARQKYDNTTNGMDTWMLNHLQAFMKSDFHEYTPGPIPDCPISAFTISPSSQSLERATVRSPLPPAWCSTTWRRALRFPAMACAARCRSAAAMST